MRKAIGKDLEFLNQMVEDLEAENERLQEQCETQKVSPMSPGAAFAYMRLTLVLFCSNKMNTAFKIWICCWRKSSPLMPTQGNGPEYLALAQTP